GGGDGEVDVRIGGGGVIDEAGAGVARPARRGARAGERRALGFIERARRARGDGSGIIRSSRGVVGANAVIVLRRSERGRVAVARRVDACRAADLREAHVVDRSFDVEAGLIAGVVIPFQIDARA